MSTQQVCVRLVHEYTYYLLSTDKYNTKKKMVQKIYVRTLADLKPDRYSDSPDHINLASDSMRNHMSCASP